MTFRNRKRQLISIILRQNAPVFMLYSGGAAALSTNMFCDITSQIRMWSLNQI